MGREPILCPNQSYRNAKNWFRDDEDELRRLKEQVLNVL
jgi:hypothetical protein